MKVYRSRIDEDGVRHITVNGEPLEMSAVLNEELPDLSLSILADYFADIAALWFSWSYHKDFAIRLSMLGDNWTLTSGDVERLLGIPPNPILHTITKTVVQKRRNTEK
jgi:hypothetical protein